MSAEAARAAAAARWLRCVLRTERAGGAAAQVPVRRQLTQLTHAPDERWLATIRAAENVEALERLWKWVELDALNNAPLRVERVEELACPVHSTAALANVRDNIAHRDANAALRHAVASAGRVAKEERAFWMEEEHRLVAVEHRVCPGTPLARRRERRAIVER